MSPFWWFNRMRVVSAATSASWSGRAAERMSSQACGLSTRLKCDRPTLLRRDEGVGRIGGRQKTKLGQEWKGNRRTAYARKGAKHPAAQVGPER
jgi:hypothetical protein